MTSSTCPLCGMHNFKHFHGHTEPNRYDHPSPAPDCPNYRELTGDRNQCPNCGEYFNSTTAFAKHRVDNRCLTPAEMTSKRFARPMIQITDKKGRLWWASEAAREPRIHPAKHVGDAEIDPGYPDSQED